MFAISLDYIISRIFKLYFCVTMVTAIDAAMMPSCFSYSVNKYIKNKLGFQTSNIHESNPLGQEIYGSQVQLGCQTTNIH